MLPKLLFKELNVVRIREIALHYSTWFLHSLDEIYILLQVVSVELYH